MYRKRLRSMPSATELARMYAAPHDHRRWADHEIRVRVTIEIGRWMLRDQHATAQRRPLIADLSTGNAAIPTSIVAPPIVGRLTLGDLAPASYEHMGPIERTIEDLDDDSVDLFVCSETIEHLDDPDAVLARIHAKAHRLLLSTPIGETNPDDNPEHIWGWDVEAVEQMLFEAGWKPVVVNELHLRKYVYDFMIIGCERIPA